jgi:hypothetical protein
VKADDIKETFSEISDITVDNVPLEDVDLESDISVQEQEEEINEEVESDVISADEGESLWDSFEDEEDVIDKVDSETVESQSESDETVINDDDGIPEIEEIGNEVDDYNNDNVIESSAPEPEPEPEPELNIESEETDEIINESFAKQETPTEKKSETLR